MRQKEKEKEGRGDEEFKKEGGGGEKKVEKNVVTVVHGYKRTQS